MRELRRVLDRRGARRGRRGARCSRSRWISRWPTPSSRSRSPSTRARHFYRGNPALWTGEAIFAVIALVTRDFAPLPERLEAAAARLRAIPRFLRRRPADADRVADAMAGEGADGSARPPRALFGQQPAGLGDSHRAWLRDDMRSSRRLRDGAGGLRPVLRQWLRAGPAAGAGWKRARRARAVRPAAHAAGTGARRRSTNCWRGARGSGPGARTAWTHALRAAGLDSWPAAQAALAALRPTADDYLPRFERTWQRCHDAVLAADLVTWPDRPLRYVPIPPHTRDAAPLLYYLFYRSPAPFDRLPVHDYVAHADR